MIRNGNGKGRGPEGGFTIVEALVVALLPSPGSRTIHALLHSIRPESQVRGSCPFDCLGLEVDSISGGFPRRKISAAFFRKRPFHFSAGITYQMQVDQGTVGAPNWQLANGVFPANQRNISADYPGVRIDGRAGAPSAQAAG